jgi:putative flippase GtrA
VKFSVVGGAGLAVQLAVLWVSTRLAGISPAVAIVIAVEAALLHNFVWHEVWTWRGISGAGRWTRLWRFHAATGSISIVSNVVLTAAFKNSLAIPLLAANVMAVGVTAILNFAVAEAWVFQAGLNSRRLTKRKGRGACSQKSRDDSRLCRHECLARMPAPQHDARQWYSVILRT